jgi:hypothetical protein
MKDKITKISDNKLIFSQILSIKLLIKLQERIDRAPDIPISRTVRKEILTLSYIYIALKLAIFWNNKLHQNITRKENLFNFVIASASKKIFYYTYMNKANPQEFLLKGELNANSPTLNLHLPKTREKLYNLYESLSKITSKNLPQYMSKKQKNFYMHDPTNEIIKYKKLKNYLKKIKCALLQAQRFFLY